RRRVINLKDAPDWWFRESLRVDLDQEGRKMNPARFVAVAAIAVGVGWISPASAATIKVSTDPAIDNTGSPGWQVSPDGTSWASAVASFAFGTVGGIWDSSPAVETLFFRRTFGLSS